MMFMKVFVVSAVMMISLMGQVQAYTWSELLARKAVLESKDAELEAAEDALTFSMWTFGTCTAQFNAHINEDNTWSITSWLAEAVTVQETLWADAYERQDGALVANTTNHNDFGWLSSTSPVATHSYSSSNPSLSQFNSAKQYCEHVLAGFDRVNSGSSENDINLMYVSVNGAIEQADTCIAELEEILDDLIAVSAAFEDIACREAAAFANR